MSDDSDETPISDADRLAGELLDEHRGRGGDPPDLPVQNSLAALSHDQRLRLAELQLLDSLLEVVHRDNTAQIDAHIQRVLAKLDDGPAVELASSVPLKFVPAEKLRRRWRMLTWFPLAIAAALLLAIVSWRAPRGEQSAYASVNQAYQAALDSSDREYRVTLEQANSAGSVKKPLDKKPAVKKPTGALYVRGENHYALRHQGVFPGEFWIGRSGKQSWFVPVFGPVLVSEDPSSPLGWLDKANRSLPYLQITAMLEKMADRYVLEFVASETLEGHSGVRWRHIHGRRRAGANVPHEVDLWIHPDSGVAGKVLLSWDDEGHGRQQVSFDLDNENRQPDDWYNHEAHHATSRSVLSLPGPGGGSAP